MTHTAPHPTRVLHIIDLPGAGWDALSAAAHCAETLETDQHLLLISDSDSCADAASFGLRPDYRICPPLNRLAAAVAPLDRLFRALAAAAPVDVIQVWSDSARVLCRETLGYTVPIVQEDPSAFVRPIDLDQRASARAALRITDHETAVLLAADRPGAGDARRHAGLVGILHLANIPTVGIASSRCDNARRAARFLRGFHRAWDCISVPTPPHVSLAAADIVLYDQGDTLTSDSGPGPRTGGIAIAAARAGLPVIAVDTPLTRRLIGPLGPSLLAHSGRMPEIARVLVPLCESTERRRTIGEELKAHAATLCTPTSSLLSRWQAAHARGAAA